jgi:hypothetical protein
MVHEQIYRSKFQLIYEHNSLNTKRFILQIPHDTLF